MLAMVVNDGAQNLTPRAGLRLIASMLAPRGRCFAKRVRACAAFSA